MKDTLDVDSITEAYEKTVKIIEEEIRNRFNISQNDLRNCNESDNTLTVSMIERAQENYKAISKCTEAIKDGHSEYVDSPARFNQLLGHIMEGIQKQIKESPAKKKKVDEEEKKEGSIRIEAKNEAIEEDK